MNLEVPDEFIQQIIVEELKWHYLSIAPNAPNARPPMFSYDEEIDKKEVKKLRKALKRVLEYYGHKVQE